MTSAQKELSTALRKLSDSHGGVVAQVEYANNRLTYSLESRAKTMDALLHEWKSDLLRIWIPLVAGAAMLIGLFGGMGIQGCRDAVPTAAATPTNYSGTAFHPLRRKQNALQMGSPKAAASYQRKGKGRHGA